MSQVARLDLKSIFWEVRQQVLARCDHLPRIKLEQCFQADQDHERERRVYAHWGHKKGIICYAKAFEKLPIANQRGILYHEFGHAIDDFLDETDEANKKFVEIEDDEVRADFIAVEMFDVPLSYDRKGVQIIEA